MATFLDISGLSYFSNIFVFLFVFVVVYGMIQYTKILGENKILASILGFVIAIFAAISNLTVDIVATIAPLVAVLMIGVVLLNTALKMLGTTPHGFDNFRHVFLIIVIVLVLVVAGMKVRDAADVPDETPSDLSRTVNLIFHPTFLGTVLIFGIAVFTIALLASRTA